MGAEKAYKWVRKLQLHKLHVRGGWARQPRRVIGVSQGLQGVQIRWHINALRLLSARSDIYGPNRSVCGWSGGNGEILPPSHTHTAPGACIRSPRLTDWLAVLNDIDKLKWTGKKLCVNNCSSGTFFRSIECVFFSSICYLYLPAWKWRSRRPHNWLPV